MQGSIDKQPIFHTLPLSPTDSSKLGCFSIVMLKNTYFESVCCAEGAKCGEEDG